MDGFHLEDRPRYRKLLYKPYLQTMDFGHLEGVSKPDPERGSQILTMIIFTTYIHLDDFFQLGFGVSLEVKDHKTNRPLELLIINPY